MASEQATAIAKSVFGHATQDPKELACFLDILLLEPPKTVLEVGVAYGGTMQAWSKAATDDALLVGVDLESHRAHFLVRADPSAIVLDGDSHSSRTYEAVVGALSLPDGETIRAVDFLFIDGEHTEAGASADYTIYAPLVRKGGIIAFHDAAGNEEVKAAIKALGLNLTLIHNAAETRHCMGIGWMRVE